MRGKRAPKRKISPDPKFNSMNIAKLVNYIMQDGKKSTARRVVYDCFETIKEKTGKDPLEVYDQAMKNISPDVEVRGRRIGGGNYQIPVAVMGERKQALGFRWLLTAARSRKGMAMSAKLAQELMDAAEGNGAAVKKREDVYKMAEANRAFAHLAVFK